MPPGGDKVRPTFSGGMCRWKPGEDVRELLSRADSGLYKAKAEGGSTVLYIT
jgi:PleD family two-component response regulator